MSLLGAGDESLPTSGDSVRDLLDPRRVVVIVLEQGLGPLLHVDGGSVGFLDEKRAQNLGPEPVKLLAWGRL